MYKKDYLLLVVFVLLGAKCLGQSHLRIELHKSYHDTDFLVFVDSIESSTDIKFYFEEEWVKNLKVKQLPNERNLHEILVNTLSPIRMEYVLLYNRHIVLVNEQQRAGSEKLYEDVLFYKISGFVKDVNTTEVIPYSVVQSLSTNNRVVASSTGYFEILLPKGVHELVVSATGMKTATKRLRVFSDLSVDIEMFENVYELDEVVVSGAASRHINGMEMGGQNLSTQALKTMPALLGEVDVVRSLLSLPGVKSVGEGSSGFNVRGGNVDQNLILLDNAPIFSSSHLFGLFSVINSDAIKSVDLQKGSFTPRYGGRLSSTMDIGLQDGLDKPKEISASIGTISSKLLVSMPFNSNKSSVVMSARYAYPNWVLKLVPENTVRNSSASFYDVNVKYANKINEKNYVSLTIHSDKDEFKLPEDTTYNWGGEVISLQWQKTISSKMDSKLSLYHSRSRSKVTSEFVNGFELTSAIATSGISYEFFWDASRKHIAEFGFQANVYEVNRGEFKSRDTAGANQKVPGESGIESSLYASDVMKITRNLSVMTGARLSLYAHIGDGKLRVYEPNLPKNESTFLQEEKTSRIDQTYLNIEPRISLKYDLTSESSVKLGYNRNYQYLSLLSNTMSVSPVDTWKLSDRYLKPQASEQLSLGYFLSFNNAKFDVSIEGYYKKLSSIPQYKEGAQLLLNDKIEQELLSGSGRAYGFELYLKKSTGKITGWVSYTYSRSFVKVKSNNEEETLSKGNFFPSNFDKPHDLSTVIAIEISKRVSLATNFVYSTGRPITYPESVYVIDGYAVTEYSEINQARVPNYHRLDASINFNMLKRRSRKIDFSWSLGVYNLYARKNPFSVFFRPEYSGKLPQAYRLSVIGTVVPYVNFNIRIK